jgi:hypothetical protein
MHDRLDVATVRTEQQPIPQLAFVGWDGENIVDADGEGVSVFLARLLVRVLWHLTNPPGVFIRRRLALPVAARKQ